MIAELIDKQDTLEIVRDQIAAILALETANQQALATEALKDPDLWKLRVYSERSNPWEAFRDSPTDVSPLVNVWVDSANYDGRASNIFERQKCSGTFNIDCYGYGVSADSLVGHTPGDKSAAFEVQRAVRLVRNILMAAEYTYLGLQGTVWKRWPQSVEIFQPQIDNRAMQNLVGARLALVVDFNEFSPQVVAETLELLTVNVTQVSDGAIIAETDYSYPL